MGRRWVTLYLIFYRSYPREKRKQVHKSDVLKTMYKYFRIFVYNSSLYRLCLIAEVVGGERYYLV